MAGALALLVGCVRVLALVIILGGTGLVWRRSLRARGFAPAAQRLALLHYAEKYERYFWLGLGLLVMTGLGSLVTLSEAPLGSTASWVLRLALALLAVGAFLVCAALRTLLVLRLSMASDRASARLLRLFPILYGSSGLALVGLVLLAMALARTFMAPGA